MLISNISDTVECLRAAQAARGRPIIANDVPHGALIRLGPNKWNGVYLLEREDGVSRIYPALMWLIDGEKPPPHIVQPDRQCWLVTEPADVVQPQVAAGLL